MAVLKMERKSADNVYLHRDFHSILNLGIDYLHERFGAAALREYLERFALHFYAPLIDEIRLRGFEALKERFEKIYSDEDASEVLSFEEKSENELIVRIESCPARKHMLENDVRVSPCFSMTSSVLWQTVCNAAGVGYALLSYEETTGKATHFFYRERRR